MSNQLNFLLNQAMHYIQCANLSGAELLLKQILKVKSTHSEALRQMSLISAQRGNNDIALQLINRAIDANKKNGILFSNKGNILSALGQYESSIEAHKIATKLNPSYAGGFNNLGNALQEIYDYQQAIDSYHKALLIDPNNLDFVINLGNAYWRANFFGDAIKSYRYALKINPNHAGVNFYLGQLLLFLGCYDEGWSRYEWRWLAKENQSAPLRSSRPLWLGQSFDGCLYVWAEQGIGDQILYASMLCGLRKYPQKKIISIEKKLLPIFERSFPDFKFIANGVELSESEYDQQISIASLGQYLRVNIDDFKASQKPYLVALQDNLKVVAAVDVPRSKGMTCGIAWRSSNNQIGKYKSIDLIEFSKILKMDGLDFINLQYGDTYEERVSVEHSTGIQIRSVDGLDLYDDVDDLLSLIDTCDFVITSSNSVAHMSGAIGKKTILFLPFSHGKFWYWHDVDGVSLWYPSIRVFKQEKQGDWSKPIEAAKAYMEDRFGI
ncbi:MAG: hypothetical protein B7Y05_04920 [Polynucleobacter sp. 24-46-87]|uniref:tetratricopeptide repeat protein n=1 Tax=Polynucleobacter sp. 39-46-10 TaxID=1970428 RepID=UPI000BD20DDB|nr:tetratricopeptide repeat protein [Polynucleobacter sp. 39-46-10]OZA15185.1 MAG: hypothetical protein B7Y05_04920 [Polynucleobacter sp. 24-46-87]OZA76836.1 MAG: hypothetical protein B7X71_07005 [Polynucleobacter sp. 39-46-10]